MRKANINADNLRLNHVAPRIYRTAAGLGLAALLAAVLAAAFTSQGTERFYAAYLVSFSFFLSVALGALFFVLLQHLTGAGWSVVVRRPAEAVAGTIPILAMLSIPLLLGLHVLYPWTNAELAARDHVLQWKHPYLNVGFFIVRWVLYFLVWGLLSRYFIRLSHRQDETGDVGLTLRMERRSAPAMIIFAVTVTFAAFDLLMSRAPHWSSTMFGVYYFSGSAVGFFASLPIIMLRLQRAGYVQNAVTREHFHDLGKLVFAFVVFWAYIAYSQYMLTWYANIPEETSWYLRRQTGPWTTVSLTLLFGHFIVPFWLLISRRVKRQKAVLAGAAAWVLCMHWLDTYWLVMPEASHGGLGFSVYHVLCFVGLGGLIMAAVAFGLRNVSLIPTKDPRLEESLAFENV